ncbi:DUF3800 domain-containing protein (plasmid) [Embleya sp. NBC_00888]|uniref:DUF3800 domain-containing protein n=1 Tax=Embleya sp. NBC_00888 TaxID=2975960 RepID=UPI002F911F87|nr:DUF3800 domain-containing protein [Embleya sp. NBC_00888]
MNTRLGSLPVVYADESSNSGQNLLDPDQPVFTVAGVHLADELAASIVDKVRAQLPRTQGEPKYGSLARSAGGRKALMGAFEQLPEGSTRSYIVRKSFMVTTKMVDVLVEPRAYANGFNLYEGKQALGLAELLYEYGPVLGDAAAFQRLLQTFVDWLRQRASTDDLFATVAAYKESVHGGRFAKWIDLLASCRREADQFAANLATGEHSDPLDPAVPSLYCLCTSFGKSIGPFSLVHDTSKVIDRNAALLRMVHLLPDPARPGQFMEPLMATRIDFADSTAHPQLQLADWAAGAARQWATHRAVGGGDRFSKELENVVLPWLVDGIWPSGLNRRE